MTRQQEHRKRIEQYLREGRAVSGGKVSDQEKAAQAQSAQEAKYLQGMMQTQFSEQQGLLNSFLIPQLKQMVSNPQGFGAQALSAMQSQLINTVGTQLSSQEKQVQQNFASNNLAGLSSGVQQSILAGMGQNAAGTEASGLANIAIQNAQLKNQQQQFGLQNINSATSLLGQSPQSAALSLQGNNQNFDQSYKIAQQGSMWQNLLGGVLGAGLNFATGGLSGLATGALGAATGGGGGGGGTDASAGGF